MPKKSRSAKSDSDNAEAVVTFFRKGKLKKMFLADKDEVVRELDFFETAELLNASEKTRRTKLNKEFYKYLEKNKEAFKHSTTEIIREFKQKGGRSSETALINVIKAIERFPVLTDDDEDHLQKILSLLNEGALPKQTSKSLLKEIKRAGNDAPKILYILKTGISKRYFEPLENMPLYQTAGRREVILSEFFTSE